MKNNNERILLYLSELMDQNEQIEFEKDLSSSEELRNDLNKIKNQIGNSVIPEDFSVDERYFTNLLPRVRNKLGKREKIFSLRTIYYAVPTAAAVLVFTLLMVNSKPNFETGYKDLAQEVVNNFSDQSVSDKFFVELESSPADEIATQSNDELNIQIPADLEISSDSYIKLIDNSISDDYSTLRRLSEKELEIVYQNLNTSTSKQVVK